MKITEKDSLSVNPRETEIWLLEKQSLDILEKVCFTLKAWLTDRLPGRKANEMIDRLLHEANKLRKEQKRLEAYSQP